MVCLLAAAPLIYFMGEPLLIMLHLGMRTTISDMLARLGTESERSIFQHYSLHLSLELIWTNISNNFVLCISVCY